MVKREIPFVGDLEEIEEALPKLSSGVTVPSNMTYSSTVIIPNMSAEDTRLLTVLYHRCSVIIYKYPFNLKHAHERLVVVVRQPFITTYYNDFANIWVPRLRVCIDLAPILEKNLAWL